jgi:hypothetical protein
VGGSRGPDPPAKTRTTCVNRANPMSLLEGVWGEGTTAVVCAIPAPSVAIYTVVTQSVVDSLDLSSVVAMIEKGLPL